MKLIRLILISSLTGLISCGNDLDITVYADPVPVVYGIVCPNDSVHRIRLMKSFICEENIFLHSHDPDSIYYPEAQVFLETRTPTGEVVQRTEMHLVELPEREPGLFVTSPNLVYECVSKDLIKPLSTVKNLRYALTIYLPGIEKAIVAESLVPPMPESIKPDPGLKPFELNLFDYQEPIKFSWRRSMDFYVELETRVNYLEQRAGEWYPASIISSRKYNHWDRPPVNPFEEVIIHGDWFFPMVGGRIPEDPEVSMRKFVSIDFQLKTSDPLFYDYFAFGHYLTDLADNTFTNVVNGIGIFAAYNRTNWEGFTIDQRCLDSLAMGKYTGHLKFSRWQ